MKDWMIAAACWLLLPVIFLAFLAYALGWMVALLLDHLVCAARKARKQQDQGEQERLGDVSTSEGAASHSPTDEQLSSSDGQHEGVTTMVSTVQQEQDCSTPAMAPPVTQSGRYETCASFVAGLECFARTRRVRFSHAEAVHLFIYYCEAQRAQREELSSPETEEQE
jgi:hypothetical protein